MPCSVGGLRAVWHDLGIDTAVTFEYTKYRCFAERTASALTFDAPRTKVRFVNFDLASERHLSFTKGCNTLPNSAQVSVHGIAVERRYFVNLSSVEIKRKKAHELAEFYL